MNTLNSLINLNNRVRFNNSISAILFFFICLTTFNSPIFSEETSIKESLTLKADQAYSHYLQRINGEIEPSYTKVKKGEDRYTVKTLFKRKFYNDMSQDVDQSYEVFNFINFKSPDYVSFNQEKITPFDGGGTCSAMALDFLSRYTLECSELTDVKEIKNTVASFAPFYEGVTTTFVSRQAAYNTIKVDKEAYFLQKELVKTQKMQSLANYHNFSLEVITNSIDIYEANQNPLFLDNVLNNLSFGTYIIRALSPASYNEKMEWYGHTMILIKEDNFSIFYDNSVGAIELTGNVGMPIRKDLLNWGIPELKIYKATHNDGYNGHEGIDINAFNLSTDLSEAFTL